MKEFTKPIIRKLQKEIAEYIDNSTEFEGTRIVKNSCSWNSGTIKFTIELIPSDVEAVSVSQQQINDGLAPIGTIGYVKDSDDFYECQILKVNRTRYVCAWIGEDGNILESEPRFTINFRGVKSEYPK